MKKEGRTGFFSRLKYGAGAAGLLALLIVFLAALNIIVTSLEKKNGWRMDCSFNGITTRSETTHQVLSGLTGRVHIYALFSKGQEDAPLMELLDRYAAESSLVTWEQVDPAMNPTLLARFSGDTETVSSDSLIVYGEETGRWRILSPGDFISLSMDQETGSYTYAGYTYEQALTGAILYVTRERIPRVVILQGHGELDGSSLQAFEALLRDNQYEVVYGDLADKNQEIDPSDLLVFFSPLVDLMDTELERLTAFAAEGGSFLFTCDATDPLERMPDYASLLRSYGIVAKEGIVVANREDTATYYNNILVDLIPEMLSTDVTMDLLASGADTVLLTGTRAFETPGETDRNLMVFPVLRSGSGSYLKKLDGEISTIDRQEGDEEGPFTLALQARRVTTEGYVSRAFAMGCSAALTDEQIYAMTDTRQLIIRMIEFLLNTEGAGLQIEARDAIRPGLSARGNGMGSLMVTVLPLGVLLCAALVLWPRRRR